MSTFKSTQHRVLVRGRVLHFVSYEGKPAHAGRGEAAEPPMWYLMCEGHRRPVMPHLEGQPPEEVMAELLAWAAANTEGPASEQPVKVKHARRDVE